MARASFGGGVADFVIDVTADSGSPLRFTAATLTMWTAETGGSPIVDLLVDGVAASTVPVGTDGQIPTFQGPSGVVVMWAQAGGGARVMIDAAGDIAILAQSAATTATSAAADAEAAKVAAQAVGATSDAQVAVNIASGTATPAALNTAIDDRVPQSTTTAQGKVELATNAEVTTGTDTARAVTPAGVKTVLDPIRNLSDSTFSAALSASIGGQVAPAVAAEQARAQVAEAALQTAIGTFTALGTFRGLWDSGTDYAPNDVVSYSSALYSATGNPTVGDVPGVAGTWSALPTTVDTTARDGGGAGQKKLAIDKAALIAQRSTRRNQFTNPGAEYSTIPGTVSGSVAVTRTAAWAANGTYSYRLTFSSTSTASRWVAAVLPCAPGQPVFAAATAHNASAAAKEARIVLRYYPNADGTGTQIQSVSFTYGALAVGALSRLGIVNPVAPAGTASVVLTFDRFSGGAGAASGDLIDLDDIAFEVGQPVPTTDRIDGDLSNSYWVGTAGASESVLVPATAETPTYGDPDLLATWGDSLSSTWSNGTTVPTSLSGGWPTKLAGLLGMRHGAGGVSGDGDKGIAARMGAMPTLIGPVTIASSGNTNLTVLANAWKTNADGPGYLTDSAGHRVLGYMDFNATGGGDPDTDPDATQTGTWYFTPAVPGTAVTLVGPRVQFEPIGFNGKLAPGATRQPPGRPGITTILSRNIYYYMGATSDDEAIARILSRYRAMVDYALRQTKAPRVAVLEIPYAYNVASPGTNDEAPGSARRAFGAAVNAALKAEFAPYWCNWVTGWMLTANAAAHAGITYTTQENTDVANGIIPFRFRRASADDATDTIHLSDLGGTEATQGIYRWIQARGWVA